MDGIELTDFQKTKRGRIALFFDGDFFMSVHPDVFASSGLSVGCCLTEEETQELVYEAELKQAKEKALSLLSFKQFTSVELSRRLVRADIDRELADQAVERMQELGLINDEEYAERFARDLCNRRGFGVMRVKQEMRFKGLDNELIENALALLPDNTEAQLRVLMEKKYPLAWEDETVKRRAFAAMQRRGYRYDQIRSAFQMEPEDGDGD